MSASSSTPRENEELPRYTPYRKPREHLSTLLDHHKSPWLTLCLLSNAPAGSSLPVYFGGTTVHGSVTIDLDDPQTIRSVVVEVRGKLCLATRHSQRLLWNERRALWQSDGEREPTSIASARSWKWDFSFPIPRHCNDSSEGNPTILPSSFNLKPYIAFLEYTVFAFVKQGKWLPAEHELRTRFIYVIRERAPPSSPLRELAYSEQRAPPGPLEDSAGWEACGKISLAGSLFGNRRVEVTCKPYVSKPCVYPRGGTLSYYIEITSDDTQALQLFSSPSAISVTLVREIHVAESKIAIDVMPLVMGIPRLGAAGSLDRINTNILEGGINIPADTVPDFALAALQLRYAVNFEVQAAGFVPSKPGLATTAQPIRVVSHPTYGAALPRAPPEYDTTLTSLRNKFVPTTMYM